MRGNVIRHNYLHHLRGAAGMGSMGVYLDDCASGALVQGNVFWRTEIAVMIGGGRDVTVDNNLFVDCNPCIRLDGRGAEVNPVWHEMVYGYMKDRLEEMKWREPPYSEKYPKLKDLEPYFAPGYDKGVPPEGNVITRNVRVGGEWLKVFPPATERMLEMKDNFTDGDPRFADPAKPESKRFQLRDDSPALTRGFEKIPVERIGLEKDEYRAE